MYYPKCSFPGCYITAKELLTNVQHGEREIFVCPQHMQDVEDYLTSNRNWNFYKRVDTDHEELSCCLCGEKEETLIIVTPENLSKATPLCLKHATELVRGTLPKVEIDRLKAHNSELHLLFAI